ncbi:MAG: UDP-glucose 4-epimerase GalE [Candidatus Levybacteria bacterium RIFCSPLOWO2_12_FULL_41_12]|nr:MAG: UDP-glucose 4-epimerase GalE [Candidatus Levybacteria bacterium RIFCSPLOWO2_12_FULL_41_12]
MKILVTGGAGYIGSITDKLLKREGHETVVFDNLKYGHKESVTGKLVVGDLLNTEDLGKLKNEKFDVVIHFAAYALAGESMKHPSDYIKNNILGGLNLLDFMKEEGVKSIVFSSTCAIYGAPNSLPVSENSEKNPGSVYGESKLAFEKMLYWYDRIYGIKHMNLRYFNAAGAALDGSLGEDHDPETHLIPRAIKAALGQLEFELYGRDYDTPDGTVIRDYIHVEDLASAHLLAIEKLNETKKSDSYNLGVGRGYSNLEVIGMVKKVSGVDFPIKFAERREGDPPVIFADNKKAKESLGFSPQHSDLETIVKTAWKWHTKKS